MATTKKTTTTKANTAPKKKASGKKAAKAASASKAPKTTVRGTAEELLKKPLSYSEIVGEIKRLFPGANTTTKSVQWYASKLRSKGVALPERPMAERAKAS